MKNIIPIVIFLLSANYFITSNTFAQVISGGAYHSLAVCADNSAWGWGDNAVGELGDGTTTTRLNPVNVLTGITAVAAGGSANGPVNSHSVFLKNDGTAWTCGENSSGQLGDGTTDGPRITPVQVIGLTGITAIASAKGNHSLFLKNDGTVWACGYNLGPGQLGDGTSTSSSTPVQVINLTGITAIAGGSYHSLYVKNDGTAWACGRNNDGQLGDGTTTDRTTPVQVSGLTGITAAAGGGNHSVFLKNDGTAWTCGWNIFGQLGDGTNTRRTTPVQVSGLTGITAVASGAYHSVFLKNNGTAWACGINLEGELGDGTSTSPRTTAVQVITLSGITAIGSGEKHSLFVKSDGTVWACGENGFGQLGDGTSVGEGTTTYRTTPVQALVFGGSGPGSCNVVTLPIELLSFTADPYQGNSVLCNWATASEINNDYFTLEKSKDAINFLPFANVDGAGNSSTTLYYQYIDPDPHMGLSYYRLKQTDFNGSFSYSDIRAVFFSGMDLISIYPNPSSDFISYTIASESGGPAILKLYDMLGREVFSKEEIIEKGVFTKKLSIATLSGSYLLRIITKNQENVQKQFVVR